jgi:RNA polymerase-binding transcription factor DksA
MDSDQIRQTLESEELRLAGIRDDLRDADELDEPDQGSSGGEINSYDQHPADAASDQQAREIDLSLLEQIEAELSDVELALNKLDGGTYGICEIGGETIEPERLEALPATRYCAKHAGATASSSTGGVSPI